MHKSMRRRFLGRLGRWATAASLATRGLFLRGAAPQAAGGVSGFDHVAVPMRDTEAMVGFYRALGFHVNEGRRICSAHFGDSKINFHRPALWEDRQFTLRAPSALPPCGDFCFVWDGTEDELLGALEGAGSEVIEGPVERIGGRDRGQARGISRYVRDPDGNLLEFIIY